jgi:outer membrane lipoprotein-sorting protein
MGHKPGILPAALFAKAVYKCTQATTAAPAIAYTLENEIEAFSSAPTIARTSAGIYTFTKTGAFTANKTRAIVVSNHSAPRVCNVVYTSADVITLNFSDVATPSAADSGDFELEIQIYY